MKFAEYRRLLASASALSLLLAVSPTSLALAQHSADDTTVSSSSSETTGGSSGSDATGSQSTTTHSNTTVRAADNSGLNHTTTQNESETGDGTLKIRAAQLLSDERATHKQHTETQRQNACKQHQGEIDNRFSTLGSRAQRHLSAFNAVLTKVQAYQAAHHLVVGNYDALVADATAKQGVATSAVSALTLLSGTKVDCTATDPASSVASVKTAVDDARTALQAYRASIKALVSALLAAKDTTTGGNS